MYKVKLCAVYNGPHIFKFLRKLSIEKKAKKSVDLQAGAAKASVGNRHQSLEAIRNMSSAHWMDSFLAGSAAPPWPLVVVYEPPLSCWATLGLPIMCSINTHLNLGA